MIDATMSKVSDEKHLVQAMEFEMILPQERTFRSFQDGESAECEMSREVENDFKAGDDVEMQNADAEPAQFCNMVRTPEETHIGTMVASSTPVGVKRKDRRYGKPITEKWRPAYVWLESLKHTEMVKASEILEWLDLHLDVRRKLLGNHTPEHVCNYIQKCHSRMLADPGRRSSLEHPRVADSMKQENGTNIGGMDRSLITEYNSGKVRPAGFKIKRRKKKRTRFTNYNARKVIAEKRKEAMEHHLGSRTFRSKDISYSHMSLAEAQRTLDLLCQLEKALLERIEEEKLKNPTLRLTTDELSEKLKNVTSFKRLQDSVTAFAWSYSETTLDKSKLKGMKFESSSPSLRQESVRIFDTLFAREIGGCSKTVLERPQDARIHGRKWTTRVQGWDALNSQFKGPVACLQQESYSLFRPTWCAYTSSVALAPLESIDIIYQHAPVGTFGVFFQQGVQKVLDIRLHPGGLPQLICSCNAAPNELLMYNLMNGRAKELVGHNSQIQAVEYAMDGERVISCGTNVLKIWDSTSGACLNTLGPRGDDGYVGHKKKISAMCVHHVKSYLVATSGGEGESELLLWNVQSGQLAADLNAHIRLEGSNLPSMDAMRFCLDNLLICGSDSAFSQPAVVQIWDVDALKELMTFPANDSYITCLGTDPFGSTIITGAGDGTISLFDLRTGGAISRLPLGVNCEATSVAFSACGTYFHGSSTANHSLVWDTRMISMDCGVRPGEKPMVVSKPNLWSARPLHCLSHGDPMPTTQNAGQLPGFVDEGDGGVNDARWFQNSPILVTASGNGSIALWDVTLGTPCVRLLSSHSRCINTVALSSDDQLICSGGDDQKVVLYENRQNNRTCGWRLTHPLSDDLQPTVASDQEQQQDYFQGTHGVRL